MFKFIVILISCVLLLSSCGKKKNAPRTNLKRSKITQNGDGKDLKGTAANSVDVPDSSCLGKKETCPSKLSFEETSSLYKALEQKLEKGFYPTILKLEIPDDITKSDLEVKVTGNTKKITYTLLNKTEKIVDLKDLSLSTAKNVKQKNGDRQFLAVCVDVKCELLFTALYKIVDETIVENFNIIFKWDGKQFRQAHRMNKKEYDEERAKLIDALAEKKPELAK